MSDTIYTYTLTNAQFTDGSTISGSWTADYDPSGTLESVSNSTFTVSSGVGTTTFTSMGTLPYADSPSDSAYEIHSLSSTGSSNYSFLYLDWQTETPSTLAAGNPSLCTSVMSAVNGPMAIPLSITGTVTDSPVCYLRGTRILTTTGEVCVEDLKIGDLVVTRFAAVQPIKWIGRQSFDARFTKANRDRMPICIHAGSLGDRLPARNLFVSPGHSMLVDGQLVLGRSLVNGVTITQQESPADIHYFQIELGTHDCVIAEGAWSETYADGPGLRDQFHNAAELLPCILTTGRPLNSTCAHRGRNVARSWTQCCGRWWPGLAPA
jgi:hypothetical protein